jgi:hypothetical protein
LRTYKPDQFGRSGDAAVYASSRHLYRSGLEADCFFIGQIGVYYDGGDTIYIRLMTQRGKRQKKGPRQP